MTEEVLADAPAMAESPLQQRREDAEEFVLEIAAALHAAGTPSHRLEATVDGLFSALGLQGIVFAQPTSLMLEIDGRTRLLRVEPRDVALDELIALDRIARDLGAGQLHVSDARAALARLRRTPPRWGLITRLSAWAGAAGAAAVFFGGGATEVLLSALLSFLIGLAVDRVPARADASRILPLVGAVFVTASANLVGSVLPLRVDAVVISGLIMLLPGFTLTVGLTELATRHLASGTARLAAAGISLLQMAVGITLGQAIASHIRPILLAPPVLPDDTITRPLAILAAAVSFLVLFRGREKDLPAIVGIAFLAVSGTSFGAWMLGPEIAPFIGAVAVGTVSNLHARIKDLPSQVLLVPGIILLVPGSLGLRGVSAVVSGSGGMVDSMRMFIVGATLTAGILAANALVPPRRAL